MCETAEFIERYMCNPSHHRSPTEKPLVAANGCGGCGIVKHTYQLQAMTIRKPCPVCEPNWELYGGLWMRKIDADNKRKEKEEAVKAAAEKAAAAERG